ncbi:MAG: hypothetical protein QF467_07740 [SAR202 cluster bacterium]|nr:hypothetical protein [SAR202 cluster bacterium]
MVGTARSLDNRIVEENRKPGTTEWQLQYTAYDDPITLAAYPLNRRLRSVAIEGYASEASVLAGESIDFLVSVDPPGRFTIDFYRLGYYGGTGGRHMGQIGPFQGDTQPVPMMTIERLRECAWEKCTTFKVPEDWPGGVYLAKLTRDEPYGVQSYIIFVVKEHRDTDLLVQLSSTTWQAYNKWPANSSLYDDGTSNVYYTGPNVRISFERPYAKCAQVLDAPGTVGSGEYLMFEFPMSFWLEQQGYDVTYCMNQDLHVDPGILRTCKAFLSVGHDEYWSRKMYDEAMAARDDGTSLAFFSGNSVCHDIQFYDSTVTGAPSTAFARIKRFEDEEMLMGTKTHGPGYGDWTVTKPDHWIFEGTGAKEGDAILGIIGWEYNGDPGDIPGLEVVASSPLFGCEREKRSLGPAETGQTHHGVVYPCDKGNWVFNAGTIWWPEGLSCPPGHVPARSAGCAGTLGVFPLAQQVTSNVLDRMIKDSPRG